jgi:hypothetical protein
MSTVINLLVPQKTKHIFPDERMSASQEGPCFMEFNKEPIEHKSVIIL